jgi:YegS/Rv2252/BmrU family lipid kinase
VFTLGGDGLVGAVAGALADSGTPLGVLPGGRGNDFARVLGVPGDPAQAVQALTIAPERKVDLAECDGRPFIGIASCGFDSDANRIANESRVKGNFVYLYAALRALAAWKPARFELVLDGDERTFVGWSVAVANSKAYGGGMFMAPDASLEDGLLDVVLVGDVSKRRFLRLLPTVFKGEHVKQPNVQVLRGREVEITADRSFALYADGDPIGQLPITVRVLPKAVRVIVPKTL